MWKRFLEKLFAEPKDPDADKRAAYKAGQRQQNAEVTLELARVISGNDQKVMETVGLSIRDPAAFLQTSDGRNWKPPADVDPFYVARDVLELQGYLGAIDWRSDANELMNAINPLLERHNIRTFDWSFIDDLIASENAEALRNENLLPIVGARIEQMGLVLVSLNIGWDNYDFAVLLPEEFAKIDELKGKDFEVGKFA